jgi:lysophospholipase L1-like esterase
VVKPYSGKDEETRMQYDIWSPEAARIARRVAAGVAFGGGGLTALGAALYGLLVAEAALARKIVGRPHGMSGPPADGMYGDQFGGRFGDRAAGPIRLVMLGDSTSVGLGMDDPARTPGVLLARGLAEVAERPVLLRVLGVSGAASAELDGQVDQALADPADVPDVAVIFVGANDVTTQTPAAQAVRHLERVVRRLREAGAEVVVGTCPDLGTVRPIAQPLRWVTRRWSRQLAAAQTLAVVAAGGRTVSFADVLGPEFGAEPAEMFGPDRYHPSARGYLQAAHIVLPSVCAALGVWPEPDLARGEEPEHLAAALATREAGIEVTGSGRAADPPRRWATLLRRRPRALPERGPLPEHA